MIPGRLGPAQIGKQDAVTIVTTTAGGTATSGACTLPGGATGKPVKITASGAVAGYVVINVGTQAQFVLPVNPNAPFTEKALPSTAFPSPVNSVPISVTTTAAGSVVVTISFA
jgi:hypothetical protein